MLFRKVKSTLIGFPALSPVVLFSLFTSDAFAVCVCPADEVQSYQSPSTGVECMKYDEVTTLNFPRNPQPMYAGDQSATFGSGTTAYLGETGMGGPIRGGGVSPFWPNLEPVTGGAPFTTPKFIDIGAASIPGATCPAGGCVIPISSGAMLPAGNPYWKTRLNGSNRITIKHNLNLALSSRVFCVTLPASKQYIISTGGHRSTQLYIDGNSFETCGPGMSDNCAMTPRFYSINLRRGPHTMELKYSPLSGQSPAAMAAWLEVYDMTWTEILDARSDSDIHTAFTTRGLVSAGQSWDYTGVSDICPEGYTLDACNTPASARCVKSPTYHQCL